MLFIQEVPAGMIPKDHLLPLKFKKVNGVSVLVLVDWNILVCLAKGSMERESLFKPVHSEMKEKLTSLP
jgi:hypothetical protein